MRHKINGVIFDMDGVLIDAKDWHYDCLNEALKKFGISIGIHEHLRTFDGIPTRKKLEILSHERGLPIGLHSFLNDLKQQYTIKTVFEKCRPNFKHEFALSRLRQEGYKLAVASNSVRKTVEVMMDLAKLNQYLEFYLSNEDVNNPKPSPQIYKLAFERLGLNPNQCVILEDNEHGIKAARASGAHVLEIETIDDTNYHNIKSFIKHCEAGLNA